MEHMGGGPSPYTQGGTVSDSLYHVYVDREREREREVIHVRE